MAGVLQDVDDVCITSLSFALELGALCITTGAGHLLLLDPATRSIEEVRTRLAQNYYVH